MNESCLETILIYRSVKGVPVLKTGLVWSDLTQIFAFKGSVLTAWNFCLLCWAVDGFDEVMLNPVEGNEVTAMTGWLITWAFIGLIGSGVLNPKIRTRSDLTNDIVNIYWTNKNYIICHIITTIIQRICYVSECIVYIETVWSMLHVTYPRSITSIDSSPFGLESTFISSESFVSIVLKLFMVTNIFPLRNFSAFMT